MMESINGHFPVENGISKETDSFTSEKKEKPPRKKSVSFHENVTDIDAESECAENLQNGSQEDHEEDLSEIFNVSEKINFFKNAFIDQAQTKEPRSLGHQTSIPQARLAFVTGMVQSPSAGNCSRVEQGRDDTTVAQRDDKDDTEMKRCSVVSVEVPSDEQRSGSQNGEAMATTLTYSKIFASQKNMVTENGGISEAVVDTSSILEHREELRDLWEKRMMADENQSSTSSIAIETNSKPLQEDETEEKVVKSESELNNQNKIPNGLSNGYAKHSDVPDSNANHIHENTELETRMVSSLDADHENNNSADSLEEDNAEDFVEQKTYTSNMEQALVMTEVKEVTSSETVTSTTIVQEVLETQESMSQETKIEEAVTSSSFEDHHTEVTETIEVQESAEFTTAAVKEEISVTEQSTEEKKLTKEPVEDSVFMSEESTTNHVEETIVEENKSTSESVLDKIIIPDVSEDDNDGFVRVEECLPKDDSTDELLDLPEENDEQHSIDPSSNEFAEQSLPVSPVSSTSSEKVNHPEMEQFVKSGGVKRIIPGVQKTEQPYNSCTTETKIAMEIREMREREEELRIMREQALLSPVVSPVPPKTVSPSVPSVRTPSPSLKETPSPIPQGPGYRVSSVFGHRGISPSPSIEEERKPFNKPFSKESAVEKEIRLAKEREEELRNQKGLPPREDDSYVKPSQVKSSQVRVFGKMAGTGNSNIKQAATAKIQMEIEEQTQREMQLREMGHIQTISSERTDARVAKLKTAEPVPHANGNSHSPVNGNHTNGRISPDNGVPYKRSSPSPTNARPASIFAQNNVLSKGNISMHKFISSKGKETTFSSPRNGPFQPKEETVSRSVVPPPMVKLKRNVSVESKIQQEIMEMKMREEELRKMHMNMSNGNSVSDENDTEHEMNQKNSLEYENGNEIIAEEISPRHNKLIAQWEQRIQKAES